MARLSMISAIIYAVIYALVLDSKNTVLTFQETEVIFDYIGLSMYEASNKLETVEFQIRFGMSRDQYACNMNRETKSSWCHVVTEDFSRLHASKRDLHVMLVAPVPRMTRSWIMREPKITENVLLMLTWRGPGAESHPMRLSVEVPPKLFSLMYERKGLAYFRHRDLPLTLPAEVDFSSSA